MYTIEKTVTVTADRRLEVILPPEVPEGAAQIVLVISPQNGATAPSLLHRLPDPKLAEITRITGDIVSPAVDEADWDALK